MRGLVLSPGAIRGSRALRKRDLADTVPWGSPRRDVGIPAPSVLHSQLLEAGTPLPLTSTIITAPPQGRQGQLAVNQSLPN